LGCVFLKINTVYRGLSLLDLDNFRTEDEDPSFQNNPGKLQQWISKLRGIEVSKPDQGVFDIIDIIEKMVSEDASVRPVIGKVCSSLSVLSEDVYFEKCCVYLPRYQAETYNYPLGGRGLGIFRRSPSGLQIAQEEVIYLRDKLRAKGRYLEDLESLQVKFSEEEKALKAKYLAEQIRANKLKSDLQSINTQAQQSVKRIEDFRDSIGLAGQPLRQRREPIPLVPLSRDMWTSSATESELIKLNRQSTVYGSCH